MAFKKRVQYGVDFIAPLGSKRYYIQSAYALPDAEKIKQEKNSLINIDDSFKYRNTKEFSTADMAAIVENIFENV